MHKQKNLEFKKNNKKNQLIKILKKQKLKQRKLKK